MKTHPSVRIGAFSALAIAAAILGPTSSQAQNGAPRYEDHVLILNRQDVLEGDLNAGTLAPPLIEFDAAGNVVNSWGDPNLLDPRLHSCRFDKDNNVWIGSSPSGMIQKYSHDGSKLLLQIGKKGVFDSSEGTVKGQPLNSNAAQFFMPSSIFADPK